MSEVAVQPIDLSPEQAAPDIDSNFQFVADRLPADIKIAPTGTTLMLCELEGIGRLSTTYLGKTRLDSDPLNNFVIRISVAGEGYDGQLGFFKDFALRWCSRRGEGPVVDKNPTQPEDLAGCPAPLNVLALTVHSLRQEFARLRGIEGGEADQVVRLDDYRNKAGL